MRLVAGNTGYGIYKDWLPEDHLIDIKQVPELRRLSLSKVRCANHGPISVLSNVRIIHLAHVLPSRYCFTSLGWCEEPCFSLAVCHIYTLLSLPSMQDADANDCRAQRLKDDLAVGRLWCSGLCPAKMCCAVWAGGGRCSDD